MADSEYSIIKYPKIKHLEFYIVSIHYRNPHIHSALEISMILKGSLRQTTSSGTYYAREGDLILSNVNEMHELASNNTSNVIMLSAQISTNFCKDYLTSLDSVIYQSPLISSVLTESEKIHFSRLFSQAALSYWNPENRSYLHCIALTCLLLEFLSRLPHREMDRQEIDSYYNKTDRLNRITSFIENHYAERNILSKLAEKENVTLTYMSHFFHNNFHISFQKYLANYRFERAMYLLNTTSRSILDICTETGFSDCKHFNKLCFQTFGLSAKECRKRNLKVSQNIYTLNPATVQYMFTNKESMDYLQKYADNHWSNLSFPSALL